MANEGKAKKGGKLTLRSVFGDANEADKAVEEEDGRRSEAEGSDDSGPKGEIREEGEGKEGNVKGDAERTVAGSRDVQEDRPCDVATLAGLDAELSRLCARLSAQSRSRRLNGVSLTSPVGIKETGTGGTRYPCSRKPINIGWRQNSNNNNNNSSGQPIGEPQYVRRNMKL